MMNVYLNSTSQRVEKLKALVKLQKGYDPLDLKDAYERILDIIKFISRNLEAGTDVMEEAAKLLYSLDVFGGSRRDLEGLMRKREVLGVLIDQEEAYLTALYGYTPIHAREETKEEEVAPAPNTPESKTENERVQPRDSMNFKEEYTRFITFLDYLPLEFIMNKSKLSLIGFDDEMIETYYHSIDKTTKAKEQISGIITENEIDESNLGTYTRYVHDLRVVLSKTAAMLRANDANSLGKAFHELQSTLSIMDDMEPSKKIS